MGLHVVDFFNLCYYTSRHMKCTSGQSCVIIWWTSGQTPHSLIISYSAIMHLPGIKQNSFWPQRVCTLWCTRTENFPTCCFCIFLTFSTISCAVCHFYAISLKQPNPDIIVIHDKTSTKYIQQPKKVYESREVYFRCQAVEGIRCHIDNGKCRTQSK